MMPPCLQHSWVSMFARCFFPSWYWRSHAYMVAVVCSSCSVRGFPNVMDHLSTGILELLWYASLICVLRESLYVVLEALSVAPWTVSSWSIHWLYVYSCKVQMSVLVHWVDLKVLYGSLYCIYVDMAAPQCGKRCLWSACDHPMDDCLVYAKKIAWSMGSLSEGRGNGHCGLGSPFCHDLMPCSREL